MEASIQMQVLLTPGVQVDGLREAFDGAGITLREIMNSDDLLSQSGLALVLTTPAWLAEHQDHLQQHLPHLNGLICSVQVFAEPMADHPALETDFLDDILLTPMSDRVLLKKIKVAFRRLRERYEAEQIKALLRVRSNELQQVSSVGALLMSEKDLDQLLHLILLKSRELTAADAGSLYLVERPEDGPAQLRFKLSQNDSLDLGFSEFTLPLSEQSIAGWVAVNRQDLNIADVYALGEGKTFRFNPDFDRKVGYRTQSMLTVPLVNHEDEVIGVLQLINRKRDSRDRLTPESVPEAVIPFDAHSELLVNSLAGGASVSIENNFLYQSIERLFEGFVNAAVTAIESRDPTTAGHSSRVATLTCALAETVDQCRTGPFAKRVFNRDQMRELRYASLLHDFGKVGVREEVLLKAKKLYPYTYDDVRRRLYHWRSTLENRALRRKIEYLQAPNNTNSASVFRDMDVDLAREIAEIDQFLQAVTEANEPTVLETENLDSVAALAGRTFVDIDGVERSVLSPMEFRALSIKRGSLDEEERLEIESHVTHTFRFLEQVPWTKDLQNIPPIAHAHHEKLNGDGYPRGIDRTMIPFPSRLMTICDIFDALTAADRPYKRAVPVDRALQILEFEVKDDHVDPELVELFTAARVFDSLTGAPD